MTTPTVAALDSRLMRVQGVYLANNSPWRGGAGRVVLRPVRVAVEVDRATPVSAPIAADGSWSADVQPGVWSVLMPDRETVTVWGAAGEVLDAAAFVIAAPPPATTIPSLAVALDDDGTPFLAQEA